MSEIMLVPLPLASVRRLMSFLTCRVEKASYQHDTANTQGEEVSVGQPVSRAFIPSRSQYSFQHRLPVVGT